MKKLLCFILALAMVLTMNVSVFAAELPSDVSTKSYITDGATIKHTQDSGASFSDYTIPNGGLTITKNVPGSAGKAADDLGFTLEKTVEGDKYAGIGAPYRVRLYGSNGGSPYSEFNYDYYIVEFNIQPHKYVNSVIGSSGNGTGLSFNDLGGGNSVPAIPYTALNQEQWNKVMIVFDYTKVDINYIKTNYQTLLLESSIANFNGTGTKDGHTKPVYDQATIEKISPAASIYVNGEKYGDTKYANRLRDLMGISLYHYTAGGTTLYAGDGKTVKFYLNGDMKATFDDFYQYHTSVEPNPVASTALPALVSGTGYTASGDKLVATSPVSLSAVKAANPSYAITAYADDTFATKLSDSALLLPGNVVAAVNSATDAIGVYTVSGPSYEKGATIFTFDGSNGFTSSDGSSVSIGAGKTIANVGSYAGWKTYWGKAVDANEKVGVIYMGVDPDGTKYGYNSGVTANAVAVDAEGNVDYKYNVTEFEMRSSYATPANVHIDGPNGIEIASVENLQDWAKVAVVTDYSKIDTTYEADKINAEIQSGVEIGSTITNFDKDKVFPVTRTYVNGKLVKTVQPTRLQDRFGMYNTYHNGTVVVSGEKGTTWKLMLDKGNHITYDNTTMYLTNDAVDGATLTQVPELNAGMMFHSAVNDGIAFDDTAFVAPYADVTVADVKAAYPSYDVTVYSDKLTTATALADSAVLASGNMIRLVNKFNGVFKNFVVKDIADSVDQVITDGVFTGKLTSGVANLTGEVAGSAGKAATDKVVRWSASSLSHTTLGQPKTPMVDKDLNLSHDYYIIRFNIKPENNTGFYLAGLGSNKMANEIPGSALKQGEWNSILIKIDYTGVDLDYIKTNLATLQADSAKGDFSDNYDTATIKKISPAGYVYVNGAQYGDAYYVNRLRDLQFVKLDHYIKGDDPASIALRNDGSGMDTRLHVKAYTSYPATADFDDVYAYRTNEDVDGVALTALPQIANNDKVTAVGDRLTLKAGAALADITADNATIALYDANNAAASELASGLLVSATGANNAISAYNVSMFTVDNNVATATDVAAGNWIIIAEYDATTGNLVDCAISVAEEDGGDVSVEYTPTNASNAVRAYLLDGTGTIKPLSTPIVVQ